MGIYTLCPDIGIACIGSLADLDFERNNQTTVPIRGEDRVAFSLSTRRERQRLAIIPEELPVCVDMLTVEVYVSSVLTVLRGRLKDHKDTTLPVAESRSVLVKLVAIRDAAVFASVGPALPVALAIETEFLCPEVDISI